ncbi:MAG TPA: hypothetical protein VFH99_02960 [Candidatus Saccharimonadales bacterium]|nr:hypothetical protein [Candidatus Saccharimonadales bacterium]
MEERPPADPGELPHEGPWAPLGELDQTSRYEHLSVIFGSVSRDLQYQLIHNPPQEGEPSQYSFMAIDGNDYQETADTKIYLAFIEPDKTKLRVFDTKELDLYLEHDREALVPRELLEWLRDDMMEQAKLGTTTPNAEDMLGFIDIIRSWLARERRAPSDTT